MSYKINQSTPDWAIAIIDSLNIEDFIASVEGQPAIWNTAIPEYNDGAATHQAWDLVAADFDVEFDDRDSEQKYSFVKLLQRRWKSLRDCFRREVHRRKSPHCGNSGRRRPYIYYENLRFLEKFICSAETNVDEQEESSDVNESVLTVHESKMPVNESLPIRNKRKAKQEEEDDLLEILKNRVTCTINEPLPLQNADPDAMFLMSLVPELNKIVDSKKLRVKSEIIQVLLQAQSDGAD